MNSYEFFSVQLEVFSRSTLTHFAHFPDRFNFRFWCYSRMLIRFEVTSIYTFYTLEDSSKMEIQNTWHNIPKEQKSTKVTWTCSSLAAKSSNAPKSLLLNKGSDSSRLQMMKKIDQKEKYWLWGITNKSVKAAVAQS